jgi:23S rRNA pseudouridine2605 synthase
MTRTHLNRALSKLGILSRSQANEAILAGRVTVNGRVVRAPGAPVDLDTARIAVDAGVVPPSEWRTIVLHKPRGVVTTRRDPQGRRTVYDVVGEASQNLVAVGRLDLATSGLLLMTSDTALAHWVTDPANALPRVYVVTVRGRVDPETAARLESGISDGRDELVAHRVSIRKGSNRESHLTIELREGKNREVRRLCAAVGHEVTRLKRVGIGGLSLGSLQPGDWRELSRAEVAASFPGFKV